MLVALSMSENSANIVPAVEAAKVRGMSAYLLLGKDGGAIKDAGVTSDRIQEIHMLVLHSLVGVIERAMGSAE